MAAQIQQDWGSGRRGTGYQDWWCTGATGKAGEAAELALDDQKNSFQGEMDVGEPEVGLSEWRPPGT